MCVTMLNDWYCEATSWSTWHPHECVPSDDVLNDFHSMMDMGGEL